MFEIEGLDWHGGWIDFCLFLVAFLAIILEKDKIIRFNEKFSKVFGSIRF